MNRPALLPGLLALAGTLFVLYPATRPWQDEEVASGLVAATGSGWWIASHGFAMIGFVALGFIVAGLSERLAGTPGGRPARHASWWTWGAVGLLLPYYGVETFGLYAMAQSDVPDPVAFADAVRFGSVAMTTFALGWLALGVAGALVARAVWRSGVLTPGAGIVLAVGLALFLPQFFGPPWLRIAHGAVVAVGCVMLAVALRAPERAERG